MIISDFRPHENEKPAFPNSSGFNSVLEKFRFRHRLVWTVGTNHRNEAVRIPPVLRYRVVCAVSSA